MSFFRNLRSSITRGRSSSRDTTPVRSSRPGSVISGSSKRRDSVESNSDSVFNRSGTFILEDTPENGLHSNTSTLEKKSKKSKVLEKFSTFTKRKKTPTPDSTAYEHHPSDNATNTYYKWQAEGCNSLDYDSQTDPFNFLYDQTSLKSIHNGSSGNESARSSAAPTFDSSTYRKGKMPSELKKQLEQLKQSQHLAEHEDHDEATHDDEEELAKRTGFEDESEGNKYKTVTLNSFRKSFRDKFLQHQKEAPHNPSWFVEVEPPAAPNKDGVRGRSASKENRNDFLVFENDNYRPGSRSPIRDLNARRPARSATRSPVKRHDTFKVDRNHTAPLKASETTPSIRIEFRNSITPNVPGRMVPVGVAKPMPSTPYYGRSEPAINTSYTIKTSTTRLNSHQSPLRNWPKPAPSRSPARPAPPPAALANGGHSQRTGRYQTLVQIKNECSSNVSKLPTPAAFTGRPSRLSTRIQLGGPTQATVRNPSSSPSFAKRYHNAQHFSGAKTSQPLKQTYFGDNHYTSSPLTSARMVQAPAGHSATARTIGLKTAAAPAYGGKYQTPQHHVASSSNSLSTLTQSRSTPSHSAGGGGGGGFSYVKHQQPPSRIVVASQRRSRSPIKIPWR